MEYHPDHQRPPRHLSAEQTHDALTELDAKLDTLRRRVHATAADSAHTHTYHAHIAALERKRELLHAAFQQAQQTPAPSGGSMWADLKSGIDTFRQDLQNLVD
jgi:outer membrane murein-binding lipoprotein Lpp